MVGVKEEWQEVLEYMLVVHEDSTRGECSGQESEQMPITQQINKILIRKFNSLLNT